MSELPAELFQHWVHAREEDRGELRVYRPAGYAFRPSRGRDGFELHRDGTLIRHLIGPADGTRTRTERWTDLGGNRLRIERAAGGGAEESEVWQIESCELGVLKIRG
jgi:hypothetical protein